MLTSTQLAALKVAILAETDPQFVQWRDVEGATGMLAQWYNLASTKIVWRTAVTWDEIMLNGMDWTRCDNLSVGKARIWDWLFHNAINAMNPSAANIRAGIDAAWVGTAADLAVRAVIYTHCKRAATRGEALFATGAGTDAAPALLAFEGDLSDHDVARALNEA